MKKLTIIILFFLSNLSNAQPHLEWTAKFKEDSTNVILGDIATDNEGNVFLTGSISKDNTGKLFFLKYSPSGNLIWKKYFMASGLGTWGDKIAVDDEGSIYISGGIKLSHSSQAIMVMKYKSSGDTDWVRYYSHDSGGNARQIMVDKFKNIYLCGYPLLMKYDKDGNLLWDRFYDQSGFLWSVNGMTLDSNQNAYILAQRQSFVKEFLTIKYDSAGVFKWQKNYNRNYDCYPSSIASDRHSKIYVKGALENFPGGYYTTILIKYNQQGDTLYVKNFSIGVGETLLMYNDTINYLGGGWPARFNVNGNINWIDSGKTISKGHKIDNSGNLYSTEEHYENGIGNILFKKYLPNGVKMWEQQTNLVDSFNVFRNFIHFDKDNNIFIAINYTDPPNPYADTIVIYKYSQTVGVNPFGNELVKDYYVSQNYPNPFNPNTNIKFSIPKSGYVSLKVYDILGKEINTLVSEFKAAGSYTISFDAGNLTSGIYFYTFISGNYRSTSKMLLIK